MTLGRWQQIKSIVTLASSLPGAERKDMLHSVCGDDTELRLEVDSLLAAADAADSLPEVRAAIASATGAMVAEQDAELRTLLASVLSHQYEIIRPIGRGGMGCVYLARERTLERFVAIKVLRPDLAGAEGHRERFRREARIAARLSHPGLLGLHSFGEIDNLWYFVMTYVRGETLAERIRREGFLPWGDAHRILTEMADALECAHRHGVTHRDIKPANILLDSESGHAILADFGISKMPGAAEGLTATGAILGTPDYMSPEQVTGASDIDERSDIYSLGAVAYVMLTGREPFRGETAAATIYRRLVEDATPVDALVSSIPADLSAIVRKCMERERENRWTDARSLKEALNGILA
ncbi:MAG: serine/threonine-protein kinase, partial [Gemmatimonadales bacterium]